MTNQPSHSPPEPCFRPEQKIMRKQKRRISFKTPLKGWLKMAKINHFLAKFGQFWSIFDTFWSILARFYTHQRRFNFGSGNWIYPLHTPHSWRHLDELFPLSTGDLSTSSMKYSPGNCDHRFCLLSLLLTMYFEYNAIDLKRP
jgi:hypothetical protein